jgi:mannose-6-phosphate isomerase
MHDSATVASGKYAGRTLGDLLAEFGAALVGDASDPAEGFPLLLKFLDCDKRLPAHMHPNDFHAARLQLNDKGKTEAWYIVKADEGAAAYVGSLPDLTPEKFAAAIARGDNYDGVMKKVPTKTGETYFVPPGRLHGLDGGNLAFEIQQNSDAGFGWDWAGFVEAGVIAPEDAEAHPALAVECAYYENGVQETTREITIDLKEAGVCDLDPDKRTFCCACQYFVLERWNIRKSHFGRDETAKFNTATVLAGGLTLIGNGEEVYARKGESLLIPAGLEIEIKPDPNVNNGEVEVLRCYVPNLMRDVIGPLREAGKSDEEIAWLGFYGQGNDLLELLGLPRDTFLAD